MELTSLERAWLKLVRPAGIILFRRNIENARQTRALLGDATGLCAAHGFRCVDVEGGTVDRLRDALAPMPSAQAVALAALRRGWEMRSPTLSQKTRKDGAPGSGWEVGSPTLSQRTRKDGAPGSGWEVGSPTLSQKTRKDGAPKLEQAPRHENGLAYQQGELIARGVKAFGFNTTLAPVLDLALPASAAVMGTRAAAATAVGVVDYARPFLAGLAKHKVAGCGKHFPGLGGGVLDSHLETPSIRRSTREMTQNDLVPYCELNNEQPMVMVSHAAYPDTPGKDRPASVSPYWIATVLRKRIGYRGIVFSDDLEMGGILKFMSIEEAAVASIYAGMDLMEICHSPELILRAYEALLAEGERSSVFGNLLLERAKQTARQRAKLFAGGVSPALSARQFEALRTEILRFGETIEKAQPVPEAQPA
jgi:beta-N-acetylhexosaminidase